MLFTASILSLSSILLDEGGLKLAVMNPVLVGQNSNSNRVVADLCLYNNQPRLFKSKPPKPFVEKAMPKPKPTEKRGCGLPKDICENCYRCFQWAKAPPGKPWCFWCLHPKPERKQPIAKKPLDETEKRGKPNTHYTWAKIPKSTKNTKQPKKKG